MLAVVDRVRLGGALLLLGIAASLFAIELLEQRAELPRSTHAYECEDALVPVPAGHQMRFEIVSDLTPLEAGAAADLLYRGGLFESAECVMRVVGDRQAPAKAEQLHVIASFYHQLGHSYPIALDRNAPDSTEHLEWALQFDSMLGGAFHDQLLTERAARQSLDEVLHHIGELRGRASSPMLRK